MRTLILASSSTYRLELLSRLGLPFEAWPHRLDAEILDPDLSPHEQIRKLAVDKATSLSAAFPNALIIGSDQVMFSGAEVIGKPGSEEAAVAQLEKLSGGTHELVTATAILDSATGQLEDDVAVYRMTFRSLSSEQLRRYVKTDQPLDCAGSFRIESLGISLFSRIDGPDPTGIKGIPLMRVIELLDRFGVLIP